MNLHFVFSVVDTVMCSRFPIKSLNTEPSCVRFIMLPFITNLRDIAFVVGVRFTACCFSGKCNCFQNFSIKRKKGNRHMNFMDTLILQTGLCLHNIGWNMVGYFGFSIVVCVEHSKCLITPVHSN